MASKIDEHGLGETIVKLRQTSSAKETAEIINSKYLTCDTINDNTILRWEQANNISYPTKGGVIAVGVPLNAYEEIMNNYNKATAHMLRIDADIERRRKPTIVTNNETGESHEVYNDRGLTELLNSYTQAINMKHKISLDMVKTQKELLSTQGTKKIIDAMTAVLSGLDKEYPELHIKNKFYEKLQQLDDVWEEIKKRG